MEYGGGCGSLSMHCCAERLGKAGHGRAWQWPGQGVVNGDMEVRVEQEGEVKRKMAWPSGEVTCYSAIFGFLPLVNILEWGEMCAGYTW